MVTNSFTDLSIYTILSIMKQLFKKKHVQINHLTNLQQQKLFLIEHLSGYWYKTAVRNIFKNFTFIYLEKDKTRNVVFYFWRLLRRGKLIYSSTNSAACVILLSFSAELAHPSGSKAEATKKKSARKYIKSPLCENVWKRRMVLDLTNR